jgi:hypothetical protein
MIPSRLPRRLLTTLFVRSQNNDCIDLFVLSERAGASPYAVLRALAALADAGLVDARRLRLTLSGLALASAQVGPRAEAPGHASASNDAGSVGQASTSRRLTSVVASWTSLPGSPTASHE